MSKGQRNCMNCGAPIDVEANKCPYCDTSYFDLSSIDMGATKPFYLKIKYNGVIITQKVLPTVTMMESEEKRLSCCGGYGNETLLTLPVSRNLNTSLSFTAVEDDKGTLCTVDYSALEHWEEMMGAPYAHNNGRLT